MMILVNVLMFIILGSNDSEFHKTPSNFNFLLSDSVFESM